MGHYTRRHRATFSVVALLGGVSVLGSACGAPIEQSESEENVGRVAQAFTGTTAQVNTEYGQWKALYVKDVTHCGAITPCKRVARLDEGNDTVSEGIGYGMLLGAYLNDRPTFDGLWNYYRTHLNERGVMHWKWDANNNKTGDNEATDAIEDASIGLIVADKRGWGTPAGDTQTYAARANEMIGKTLQHFVTASNRPKPGDAIWEVWERAHNPSYLLAPYATVFATYTGVSRWNLVKDKEYQLLGLVDGFYPGAAATGLVPDWVYDNGTPNWNGKYICDASEIAWDLTGTGGCRAEWFSYDAIRTPWRLAMDWTWHADSRAGTRLDKMNAWASPKNGDIVNGYKIDGTEGTNAEYPGGSKVVLATFVGPMAAASVKGSAAYQTTMWNKLMSLQEGSNYFADTLRILSLTFVSGNMPNPLTIGGGATCSDGIQNQGETGVDCGGPCTACSSGSPNGTACTAGSQCTSGNCVDGVCCNTTCGGGVSIDCQVCNKAGSVGTCSPAANGIVCRAGNGACDVAESCNGSATTCPTDGFASSSTTCRNSAGQCDVAENCSGSSSSCPADGFAASGTTCTGGSCNGSGSCVAGGTLDPRANYNFNETSGTTAADSSGNGLNATLSGATFAAGYAGNGVRIAGGTQRVNLPANVVQSCTDATGFTIAARVNLATNGTNWARIFDMGTGTSTNMFMSPRAGSGTALRFAMKINGATEQQINYSYTFPVNTWKHIAVTLSGSTGTMYLDGAQVAQNTAFSNDPSAMGATANNWLGDSQYTADPTLDGTIDDLRIACRAYSASEISTLAGGGCTMPAAPSAAPSATGGTEQVSLSWPAVSGATSYKVRRSSTSGGPYTDVATGVTSTSYVNTVGAGTYYYVIAAVNGCGTGANSAQGSGVATNAGPSASITAPAGGATYSAPASVTINANAADTSFGNISKVEFYQGTTKLGEDTTAPYSYSWTNVPAAGYSLTVKAYDNLNAITSSSAVSITVNGGCTLPAAPGTPTATGGTGQVSLTWPAVTNATSYSIRRSSTSGGPYTEVGTSTTTSHVNTVAAGTYYYVVAAVNSCGTGANSSQVSGVSAGGGGGEPCTPSATFTGTVTSSGGFNTTGAYCFRTDFNINGWGCSNFEGRTVSINDATPTSTCGGLPMPVKHNGYYYFESTGGTHSWAAIYWW